ncbi:MAG: sigma 54-interacting transcriptional regulator [Planctomycetota bacterium]
MVGTASLLEMRFEGGPRDGESCSVHESPFVIGRDRSANLSLEDPAVSRLHMALIYRDGHWNLQDLGGLNPPLVHGRSAISLPVLTGDVIQVGKSNLRITRIEGGSPVEHSSTVEIPMRRPGAAPHRTQQLAGGKLWAILEEWTGLIRNLDRGDEFLEKAIDGFMRLIPADRGGIYQLDADSGVLVPCAVRNMEETDGRVPYSETIIARSIKNGTAKLFSPQLDDEEDASSRSRSMIQKRIRCALCLPLVGGERTRGVVYLDQVSDSHPPLLHSDLELGMLLANLLAEALEKAQRFNLLDREIVRLQQIVGSDQELIGMSPAIDEVRRRIRKVARTDLNALITGESGTGKELVARAIHDLSERRDKPFVAVNCAAIPDALLESELFGYSPRSGIHGADPEGKPGKFELADGGSLVLDEIGDLPLQLQAKLLRVLEERLVDRLGAQKPVKVDVRVIAVTNRDLAQDVKAERFREDLYYRLRVFPIHIPPLRARSEDVMPIARHIAAQVAQDREVQFSPRAIEILRRYPWPGNVRELKNVLFEALLAGDGRSINPRDLSIADEAGTVSFQPLREVERNHIVQVLEAVSWNKKKAAELLGIHRSTLYEKIAEYHLAPPEGVEEVKPAVDGAAQ